MNNRLSKVSPRYTNVTGNATARTTGFKSNVSNVDPSRHRQVRTNPNRPKQQELANRGNYDNNNYNHYTNAAVTNNGYNQLRNTDIPYVNQNARNQNPLPSNDVYRYSNNGLDWNRDMRLYHDPRTAYHDRGYFVPSPGSSKSVSFIDLPESTRNSPFVYENHAALQRQNFLVSPGENQYGIPPGNPSSILRRSMSQGIPGRAPNRENIYQRQPYEQRNMTDRGISNSSVMNESYFYNPTPNSYVPISLQKHGNRTSRQRSMSDVSHPQYLNSRSQYSDRNLARSNSHDSTNPSLRERNNNFSTRNQSHSIDGYADQNYHYRNRNADNNAKYYSQSNLDCSINSNSVYLGPSANSSSINGLANKYFYRGDTNNNNQSIADGSTQRKVRLVRLIPVENGVSDQAHRQANVPQDVNYKQPVPQDGNYMQPVRQDVNYMQPVPQDGNYMQPGVVGSHAPRSDVVTTGHGTITTSAPPDSLTKVSVTEHRFPAGEIRVAPPAAGETQAAPSTAGASQQRSRYSAQRRPSPLPGKRKDSPIKKSKFNFGFKFSNWRNRRKQKDNKDR